MPLSVSRRHPADNRSTSIPTRPPLLSRLASSSSSPSLPSFSPSPPPSPQPAAATSFLLTPEHNKAPTQPSQAAASQPASQPTSERASERSSSSRAEHQHQKTKRSETKELPPQASGDLKAQEKRKGARAAALPAERWKKKGR
ncbi:hypothetical protein Mapa_010775 [Marchantia paleacea]|nr:hypothetical protein Mapa_010775 [Marchantia paleacea]